MRDKFSCFSENSINVSNASCSSYSNNTCISPNVVSPSIQNSISSVYKLVLSTLKHLLITVTWCKNHSNQGLSISFGDEDPSTVPSFRLNTNSRFFRKKKGSKMLDFEDFKVTVLWDLSNAKYETGPEPVDAFYVVIVVDSEIGLILGDSETVTKKMKDSVPMAKISLLSRREHCSGNTVYYNTKAQFCDSGNFHDVLIKCSVENEGFNNKSSPVLSVNIDKKNVIRVKRLQWNFRGNQTIFVDGLLVDLLWDVHDWFFNPQASGYAVFMFRTRSGLDSRLWLEEKHSQKDKDRVEFSLLIYACKSS
ncbi:hypothetical protein MtrunA17_Chr4g0027091 [Medicago truncatula]|uniref:DUF868 family protein n=1 Tax=Medicago truncatula TaxID=3880 RepID=G7JKY7_MEDTR|nr:uncharacterized protein LOC11434562 [Medicago truncatula]AES88447.1 DUF868 family protein [Medicago truncatula]RHN60556.1 hypothetical protein MtrunA17_Chr4g0027091 [Medicago truncatula]